MEEKQAFIEVASNDKGDQPPHPERVTLHISNIDFACSEEEVRNTVLKYSDCLESCTLVKNPRQQDKHRGFGFAVLSTSENVVGCIEKLQSVTLGTRQLKVEVAKQAKGHKPTPGHFKGQEAREMRLQKIAQASSEGTASTRGAPQLSAKSGETTKPVVEKGTKRYRPEVRHRDGLHSHPYNRGQGQVHMRRKWQGSVDVNRSARGQGYLSEGAVINQAPLLPPAQPNHLTHGDRGWDQDRHISGYESYVIRRTNPSHGNDFHASQWNDRPQRLHDASPEEWHAFQAWRESQEYKAFRQGFEAGQNRHSMPPPQQQHYWYGGHGGHYQRGNI